MVWVDIVALLAVIQLMVFISLVGRARGRYNVPAPATTGHPVFERYFRVQMNTIECLLVLLPGLWLAPKYWPPKYVAAVGAVYLLGRVIYLRSYVRDPSSRSAGYGLSAGPAAVLVFAALVGAVRELLHG
ncbi:MAG: MAPEG family protein [Steroidobacteraceae bacterium]